VPSDGNACSTQQYGRPQQQAIQTRLHKRRSLAQRAAVQGRPRRGARCRPSTTFLGSSSPSIRLVCTLPPLALRSPHTCTPRTAAPSALTTRNDSRPASYIQ
jgi:hypothetical protein